MLNCENGPSFEEYKILNANEVCLGSFDNYTDGDTWQWERFEPVDERNVIDPSPLFTVPRWEKDCRNGNTQVVVMLAKGTGGRLRRNRLVTSLCWFYRYFSVVLQTYSIATIFCYTGFTFYQQKVTSCHHMKNKGILNQDLTHMLSVNHCLAYTQIIKRGRKSLQPLYHAIFTPRMLTVTFELLGETSVMTVISQYILVSIFFRIICTTGEKSVQSGLLPDIKGIAQIGNNLFVMTKKGICIINSGLRTVQWENHTKKYLAPYFFGNFKNIDNKIINDYFSIN